jgi:phosphoketolase
MIRRHSEEEDSFLKDFKQGVNCLLSVADHCLSSENYVNVIVCDEQKHLQIPQHGSGHHSLHKGNRQVGTGLQ